MGLQHGERATTPERPTSEEVSAVAAEFGVTSREYEKILRRYFGSAYPIVRR